MTLASPTKAYENRHAVKPLLLICHVIFMAVVMALGATASAQDDLIECPSISYYISTQAEVDALGATGCEYVSGGLRIGRWHEPNGSVIDLSPLQNIKRIDFYLSVEGNEALTDLNGLQALVEVGTTITITNNPSLQSMNEALQNFRSVKVLYIYNNPSLTSISLPRLETINNDFSVFGNGLSNFNLPNLTSIGNDFTLSLNNQNVTNLEGLASLSSVGGELEIRFGEALTDINGLRNLETVGSLLYLYSINNITHLDGLSSLTSAGGIRLVGMDKVEDLTGLKSLRENTGELVVSAFDQITSLEGLDGLSTIGGDLLIKANKKLENLDALKQVTSVAGDLDVQRNYQLTDCSGLATVLGAPEGPPQDSVSGSIWITSNAEGCQSVEDALQAVSPSIAVETVTTESATVKITPGNAIPVDSYTTECVVDDTAFRSSAPELVSLGIFDGGRAPGLLDSLEGRTFVANPQLKILTKGMVVRVATPSGTFADFRVERTTRTQSGNLFIVSEIHDFGWMRVLLRDDGNFFGTFSFGGEVYEARISDGKTVFFSTADGTLAENPFEDDFVIQEQSGGEPYEIDTAAASTNPSVITLGVQIDGALAGSNPDDVLAWIDNLVQQANAIYQNSGVNVVFSVVGVRKFEPGAQLGTFEKLSVVSCGSPSCRHGSALNSDVDSWRESVGADFIVQLVGASNDGYCGMANYPQSYEWDRDPNRLRYFTHSVSGESSGNGGKCPSNVVAHEMGHNFSLGHDRDQNTGSPLFPYGLGYKVDSYYGTAMSYPGGGHAGYLPVLSNPDINISGIPMGVRPGQPGEAFAALATHYVVSHYEDIINNGDVDLAPPAPVLESYSSTTSTVTLTFQPKRSLGQAPPSSFTANCGGVLATSSSSPITVRGLSAGATYTCSVRSTNQYGVSQPSNSLRASTSSGESFTITPTSTSGGSITPSTPQSVSRGEQRSFSISAAANYSIKSVSGCDGELVGTVYTTGPAQNDCTVSASFELDELVVTPVAVTGGSISPSTPQSVDSGQQLTFEITPEAGYRIANVVGCAGTLNGTTYTTGPITQACQVYASFERYWVKTGPATSVLFDNLPSSTRFECKTYATIGTARTEYSEPLYFVTLTAQSPSNVTIERYDYDEGEITLYAAAGDNGGLEIDRYDATCFDGATTVSASSTTNVIRITGLNPEATYTCTVSATNAVGTSGKSNPTEPIVPEGLPTGLPVWLLYEATK